MSSITAGTAATLRITRSNVAAAVPTAAALDLGLWREATDVLKPPVRDALPAARHNAPCSPIVRQADAADVLEQ